jgi:hypothetical protein
MIDDHIVRRALIEIGRLNRELAVIHEDEERCKLRRSRIEAQKAQVQLFLDQANLARRLAAQPDDPTKPIVHIEKLACGANMVHVTTPPTPAAPPDPIAQVMQSVHRRLKPAGLPTTAEMILTALKETGKASRPAEIAQFVRQRWWAGASTKIINTAVWQMARAGKLTHRDGRYDLNGAGHSGAGHNGAGH